MGNNAQETLSRHLAGGIGVNRG